MTTKKYRYYRLAIAILLGIFVSSFISKGNYLLPLGALILASLIILSLKKNVKGVIADECDYSLAGTAARYTITAFSLSLVVIFFILMQMSDKNPELSNLASIASYLACTLLLLNAGIFQFLRLRLERKSIKLNWRQYLRSIFLYFFIAIFAAGIFAAGARLLGGEDSWICKEGKWIAHGHPDKTQPQTECR